MHVVVRFLVFGHWFCFTFIFFGNILLIIIASFKLTLLSVIQSNSKCQKVSISIMKCKTKLYKDALLTRLYMIILCL